MVKTKPIVSRQNSNEDLKVNFFKIPIFGWRNSWSTPSFTKVLLTFFARQDVKPRFKCSTSRFRYTIWLVKKVRWTVWTEQVLNIFFQWHGSQKKNYFRQNGAPKFIQKNRVKWLMNWQHDATMKYYWTATTIAFIAHRQENEKEIVFYCYWRASNGIHFPWLENGFGMPFCFLNKSKGKGDKIPV